jgi:hypothetical protein
MTLHNDQDAVKQAMIGGWKPKGVQHENTERGLNNILADFNFEPSYLQDPAFWQALGKAREWELDGEEGATPGYPLLGDEWKTHALRYFETRLSNGDIAAFWQSLP